MILPAAQSAASATLSLPGQPAENGTLSAESETFAALLAGQPDPAAAAVPAAELPATPEPDQPGLAAPLPLAGKILPGPLPGVVPGVVPGLPAEAVPVAAEPGSAPEPAHEIAAAPNPGRAIPSLLAAMRALRLPVPALPGAKAPAALAAAPLAPTEQTDEPDAAQAQPFDALAPAAGTAPFAPLPAMAGSATAGPAAPATATVPTAPTAPGAPGAPAALTTLTAPGNPTAPTSLPPMIEAQLLGRPLLQREAPQAAFGTVAPAAAEPAPADLAPADLALRVDPARVDPAVTARLAFEPGAARPEAGIRLRPVLAAEIERQGPAATAPQTEAPGLLAGAPSLATPFVGGPAAAPQSTGSHPHDFAALMDRLITARDAAQTGLPQSIHVAVNHAEFGPISLQFLQDQAGLAVSVASPDPDFARAVQAAIPAAAAAASADGSARDNAQGSGNQGAGAQAWSGQNAGRGDASAMGGDTGQRRPREADTFTPDDARPARNRGAETRDTAPGRRRGIFA